MKTLQALSVKTDGQMKIVLCILALVGMAVSTHAQGTLAFRNSDTTLVTVGPPVVQVPPWPPVPVNGGYVQLLWAPAGTAWDQIRTWDPREGSLASWLTTHPAWNALTDSITPIGPAAGRFDGGTLTLATPTPGAGIEVAVIGWSGNASSFDAAADAMQPTYSPFNSFYVDTSDPNIPEIPASITGPGRFGGMVLQVIIPEPSSATLLGLGVAALFVFRRHK